MKWCFVRYSVVCYSFLDRVVLGFKDALAPVQFAILPLMKKPQLLSVAEGTQKKEEKKKEE